MVESSENPASEQRFLGTFFNSNGGTQVLVLSLLLSLSMFCIIGVVPDIVSDRYARLYHGYTGSHCSEFDSIDKPGACQYGADDAQNAAANSSLVRNLLALMSNSIVGSASDSRGRRGFMVACMFLYVLPPFSLLVLQLVGTANPVWFYVADSSTGMLNPMSIPFAMLSDLMPEQYRAASFGMFLAAFYVGFTIAPSFPLLMSHLHVSMLALATSLIGLLFSVVALPETLPQQVAERSLAERHLGPSEGLLADVSNVVLRPFRDMSILNRDVFFRLIAAGSFFSGMVYSSDATLVVYYVEDHLDVRDDDLASMFFVMGVVGIVIQGVLLQMLIGCLGEKGLLVTAFLSGTVHNLLYGVARAKSTIYIAFCLSQLTKTNFPLLASLASNNAGAGEQGLVQGAVASLTALADAIGPVSLEFIYNHTKGRPGTMFVFASLVYAIGTVFVAFIPVDKECANVRQNTQADPSLENDHEDAREPLLESSSIEAQCNGSPA